MTKEYYPLEDLDGSNTPFLSTPVTHPTTRKRERGRFNSLVRHRIFTTFWITFASTLAIRNYYGLFSTLWVYLSIVMVVLPISILQDLTSFIRSRRDLKVWWNKDRLFWIYFEIFGITLWLLSSLSLFTIFPYQTSPPSPSLSKIPSHQRYFIAANLYQSEEILPNWTKQVLDLTKTLGEENVFISIYESNSKDATKQMLKYFDQKLEGKGIKHKILSDNFGKHYGGLPTEATSDRIKMLAIYRNKAQEAFYEESSLSSSPSSSSNPRRKFDKVIWLNDIVFDNKDVLELLSTENGHFDQACGLDLIPKGFYDNWVTRTTGDVKLMHLWPYFPTSNDVGRVIHDLPLEVNSCWNGMTIFDAKWFYANHTSSASTNPLSSTSTKMTSSSVTTPSRRSRTSIMDERSELPSNFSAREPPPLPLRFRASERCYSSESFLASYDLHRAQREIGGSRPKIIINPKVKLAYNFRDYFLHTKLMRYNIVAPWTLVWQYLLSYRLFGWLIEGDRSIDKCREYFDLWYPPPPSSRLST